MKKIAITFAAALYVLLFTGLHAQTPCVDTGKPAYLLYDGNGNPVTYDRMIGDLAGADVAFLGEFHNDPISHWLEAEITRSLFEAKQGRVVLGAEMFEADMQVILDEYVQRVISDTRFEADCRLWHNYSTDYEPLVSFAREHGLPFVATNIPRRYAEMVNKSGGVEVLETLSGQAKAWMAPLPMPLKPDSVMLSEGSIMSLFSDAPLSIAKAQAVKDATMGWMISRNLAEGSVFIHYNGSYHSNFDDGIIYFLRLYAPKVKVKTVSVVKQEDITGLDMESYAGIADYVICVPETMTLSY
ncbi:ChaN family lipoprotein [Alistipes sp. OttesenSCG-928-B03]|nr:ChaN family lipoprotein [Alistipes sp. OttesenSCG-928-B03]